MITPFMNLSLPTPSVTLGPQWASDLNAALVLVDAHDHSSGNGTSIKTAGIDINADLDFNEYTLFGLRSVKLSEQTGTLTGITNALSLFSYGGDLYYTNNAGTAVKLTNGGSIVSSPGAVVSLDYDILASDLNPVPVSITDPVVYNVDTTASRTITLSTSSSATPGRILIFKDGSGLAETNPITINKGSGDPVNSLEGGNSIVIDSNYGSVMLVAGALGWLVV